MTPPPHLVPDTATRMRKSCEFCFNRKRRCDGNGVSPCRWGEKDSRVCSPLYDSAPSLSLVEVWSWSNSIARLSIPFHSRFVSVTSMSCRNSLCVAKGQTHCIYRQRSRYRGRLRDSDDTSIQGAKTVIKIDRSSHAYSIDQQAGEGAVEARSAVPLKR